MNHGLPGHRARSAGFTLIELLVVLVLAAVAVSIVGGSAQSFMARAQYHQAVREVASQLGQARSLGVQEGRSVSVGYESQERRLTIDGQYPVRLPDGLDVSFDAVQTQQPGQAGQVIFVFNADGGARGGPFIVSRAGKGTAFRVNWLLGTVEQAPAS
ncbi:MAG: prepilin-type N-terminal cleavage/methylation domain-containing protein [Proteobacteria bacterium]|nr:prepilin-type N-terminal cleavage/methylation domain-containing protein [Pseudomonadota bacterium]